MFSKRVNGKSHLVEFSNMQEENAVSRHLPSKGRFGHLLMALFMVIVCGWMISFKLASIGKLPFFDSNDGEGFYWTESAFHFRHARMISEGKRIPRLDRDIQYPEGLDTTRYITPVMDRVTGSLHRVFFQEIPLHVFLVFFSCIFSTFSIVAVFLTAKFLWRSAGAGFISAFCYALGPASFGRAASGGLLREHFALPFIFFSFACFIYCLQKDRLPVAVMGSLFLAIGLASWHATQFYVFFLVVGFVVVFFLRGGENFPRVSIAVFTIAIAAASVALAVLRAKWFIFSPQMMMCYGLLVSLWLLPHWGVKGRTKTILWGGAVIIGFLIAGLIVQRLWGSHSHVYNLILGKLRYWGELPLDATKLPFETKVMWTSGFGSPGLRDVFMILSVSLVLGAIAVTWSIFRIVKAKAGRAEIMVVYSALASFVLFLMIRRMHVFTGFFLAVPIGSVVLVKGRILKPLAYVCLGGCFLYGVHFIGTLHLGHGRPPQEYVKDMIHYIKGETGPDEAVLTAFQFGPSIAAYARRPVILHPKFESQLIRDKVKDVYTSLYCSEEDFYQTCKRYDASLFVFYLGMATDDRPGSIRYMIGATNLRKDSAAAMFRFAPDELRHFRFVHQNRFIRIFRVVKSSEAGM